MSWNTPWSPPARHVPPPSEVDVAVERIVFHANGGTVTHCQPGYAAPIAGIDMDPGAPKIAETPPPGAGAASRPAPTLSPSERHAMDILRRMLAAGPVTVAEWREACRGDGGLGLGCKPNSRSQIANRSIRALGTKGAVEIVDGFARPAAAEGTK